MKFKTLLLTTALVTSSIAFADAPAPSPRKSKVNQFEDYYAKVELGATKSDKVKVTNNGINSKMKSKTGFVGGLGGGYTFNEFFKTDLMLQFRDHKTKKDKNITDKLTVKSYAAMLNGYLTAHNDTIFTPYLLAGVGLGHNTTKHGSTKMKKTNFIWNVGLGAQAKVAEQVSVDLGYRYVNLGKLGSKDKIKAKELKGHEIVAGLVYHL